MNWGFTKFDKEPIRNNTAFLVVFLALVLPMENVSSLCSCFFNSHNLSFALQEANELLIPITFHIQGTTMIQVKLRNYQIHCNRLRLVTRETSRLKSKLNECITRCCGIDSDTNLSDSPKTLIEAGADVKWENKENTTLSLTESINLMTIEKNISRSAYKPTGSRLLFIWAILQAKLNLSSILLDKYAKEEGKVDKRSLRTSFSGLTICVHCSTPFIESKQFTQGLLLIPTITSSFTFLYCRNSFEIGQVNVFNVFTSSFEFRVWISILLFSLFFGMFYGNLYYTLDFWISILGYPCQMTWSRVLQTSFLSLVVLNIAFSGKITSDSVSPVHPPKIKTVEEFFNTGHLVYAYNLEQAKENVREYPNLYTKGGLAEDSDASEMSKYFDIQEPGAELDWPPYCVADFATKSILPKILGTTVAVKYASQNLIGVEYKTNGSAQCDTVEEPFAFSSYNFWFRDNSHNSNGLSRKAYEIASRALHGGIHNFWEGLYFSGGERYVAHLRQEMRGKGIPSPQDVVQKLSAFWKVYRMTQLHFYICLFSGVVFAVEIILSKLKK